MNAKGSDPEESVLYGIGLGPGDPQLVTLKAIKTLHSCETVFLPRTGRDTLGRACSILGSLDPDLLGKACYLDIPMAPGNEEKWARAARDIMDRMTPGSSSAYVSLGDPLLYGSFIHVAAALERLEANIRIETISGVNSFSAAAAQALFPLGTHSDRLALLCGPLSKGELESFLEQFNTLVIMKANGDLGSVKDFLQDNEGKVDWICVENCATENQVLCDDLRELDKRRWDYFTVVLIRKNP
jgi:precorrin-2/cobalt-factor-2 C20-methyltransferase